MKVLHIITRLIRGGAQENTVATVRLLRERFGVQAVLATGPPLGPEGSLVEDARAVGVEPVILPHLRRNIHPVLDALAYRQIRHIIASDDWDIVHTHSSKAGVLGRLAARRAGVPVVVHTIHGLPFHPYLGRGRRALYLACERMAAGWCDALIAVAARLREAALAAGVGRPEQYEVVHSGMPLKEFLCARPDPAVRARYYIPPDVPLVGKVARLFPLKGHEEFVEAARLLAERVPDCHFLVVGGGLLRGEIERRVREAGLAERFRFTGLVPRETVAGIMPNLQVLVHASWWEGLPRVVVQALAAGVPVVAFDVDATGEVVLDGETGFLVEPGDVAGLAERVERLLRDEGLRRRMGEAGRALVDPEFREEIMVERLYAIYERLLKEKVQCSGT